MVKILKALPATLLLTAVTATGVTAQTVSSETELLRRENRELRLQVDSLNRTISRLAARLAKSGRTTSAVSSLAGARTGNQENWNDYRPNVLTNWDRLTGMVENAQNGALEAEEEQRQPVTPSSAITASFSAPGVLTMTDDKAAERYVTYYTRTIRSLTPGILGRYAKHEESFRQVFAEYGIPDKLTALAIVESAVTAGAVSRAGAGGCWQLMPDTAREHGLRVDEYIDERFDIEKSTTVAAAYLKELHDRFADWGLAVMAYNCGPGAVMTAIRNFGNNGWEETAQHLPEETREYIPALLASIYIIDNQDTLGISATAPKDYTTVIRYTKNTTFEELQTHTGVPEILMKRLNPVYVSGLIPGQALDCTIAVPTAYKAKIEKYLSL